MKWLFYEQLLLVAEAFRLSQLWYKGQSNDVPFVMSTTYPSAVAIISLPSPTFHCMFTWIPLLLCTSCVGGTKIKRSTLIINSADSGILNGSSHALFCFFGNFRETWTRYFDPCDALFLLFNVRHACVGPLLYPPLIKCSIKTLPSALQPALKGKALAESRNITLVKSKSVKIKHRSNTAKLLDHFLKKSSL